MKRAASGDFPLRIVKNKDSFMAITGDGDYVNKATLREGFGRATRSATRRKFSVS
jgi:hypothetical protein